MSYQFVLFFGITFLIVLDILFYMYLALKNKTVVKLTFFDKETQKRLSSLIMICLLDGIIIGIFAGVFIAQYWLVQR